MPSPITAATDDTFAALVSTGAVLLDFTAAWCPPCHAQVPALEALAVARPALRVVSVDVDACPAIASRFGVRAMPTLVLLQDGAVVAQRVGAQSRPALERWVTEAAALRAP